MLIICDAFVNHDRSVADLGLLSSSYAYVEYYYFKYEYVAYHIALFPIFYELLSKLAELFGCQMRKSDIEFNLEGGWKGT